MKNNLINLFVKAQSKAKINLGVDANKCFEVLFKCFLNVYVKEKHLNTLCALQMLLLGKCILRNVGVFKFLCFNFKSWLHWFGIMKCSINLSHLRFEIRIKKCFTYRYGCTYVSSYHSFDENVSHNMSTGTV